MYSLSLPKGLASPNTYWIGKRRVYLAKGRMITAKHLIYSSSRGSRFCLACWYASEPSLRSNSFLARARFRHLFPVELSRFVCIYFNLGYSSFHQLLSSSVICTDSAFVSSTSLLIRQIHSSNVPASTCAYRLSLFVEPTQLLFYSNPVTAGKAPRG